MSWGGSGKIEVLFTTGTRGGRKQINNIESMLQKEIPDMRRKVAWFSRTFQWRCDATFFPRQSITRNRRVVTWSSKIYWNLNFSAVQTAFKVHNGDSVRQQRVRRLKYTGLQLQRYKFGKKHWKISSWLFLKDFLTRFSSMNFQKSQSTNVLKALRKRKQQSMHNGMESLEILRSNIQSYFNDKINNVTKEFVNSFFQPAIVNIKNNTNETISEQQMQTICKTMLENCLKQQYSSTDVSSPCSSSRNTSDVLTSDSDNDVVGGAQTSLLHQALKRKRNDSDNEQLVKQQFFLTKASNSYFSGSSSSNNSNTVVGNQHKLTLRSAGAAVTNAALFTSTPKFITTRSTSSRLFQSTQSASTPAISRPIFHIIQTPKNLVATHVELAQLLSNSTSDAAKKRVHVTSSNVVSSTSCATDSAVTSTQSDTSADTTKS